MKLYFSMGGGILCKDSRAQRYFSSDKRRSPKLYKNDVILDEIILQCSFSEIALPGVFCGMHYFTATILRLRSKITILLS